MLCWVLPLFAFAVFTAQAPKYAGPLPPKADIPYLKHANNLVETETVEFKEEKSNNDILYTAPGETSTAKTPLALPVFLIKTEKLNPERLLMYRLEPKNGRREITLSEKKNAKVIHVLVTHLTPEGLVRLDVADDLDSGQYVLSMEGTDRGFCFEID